MLANDTRVKVFRNRDYEKLQAEVNAWLKVNTFRLLDVQYQPVTQNYHQSAFTIYSVMVHYATGGVD